MARTRKSMRVESVYKEFKEAASKGKQDKPFKCRYCSSRYTLPSSRSRHKKQLTHIRVRASNAQCVRALSSERTPWRDTRCFTLGTGLRPNLLSRVTDHSGAQDATRHSHGSAICRDMKECIFVMSKLRVFKKQAI